MFPSSREEKGSISLASPDQQMCIGLERLSPGTLFEWEGDQESARADTLIHIHRWVWFPWSGSQD